MVLADLYIHIYRPCVDVHSMVKSISEDDMPLISFFQVNLGG